MCASLGFPSDKEQRKCARRGRKIYNTRTLPRKWNKNIAEKLRNKTILVQKWFGLVVYSFKSASGEGYIICRISGGVLGWKILHRRHIHFKAGK